MIALRSWILSVVSCALLLGTVNSLLPEGSGRRLARFTGGLLLLLVLLRPIKDISLSLPTLDRGDERYSLSAAETELSETCYAAWADSIARETNAYIESRASELGLLVRAEVGMKNTDGVPIPERVTLYGRKSAALSACIERELGITGEKQTWIETEK